jgi:site-specific DNA recombinase
VRKAVGYLRVSTLGQVEHGLGLDIQRDAITAYCGREHLHLVGFYEDAGISGANGVSDRVGWPKLIDALEQREFESVIILRLDRLARDLMLQENMLTNVLELGGELISIDEPDLCDSDPTRVMFRQIKGAVSQYEKAMIVARLRAGRRKKARMGGYSGGWLPYGYRVEGNGRAAQPRVDACEASVIRRVFEEYAAGSTMRIIARGLALTETRTRRGGEWHESTVRAVLNNPFYTGEVEEHGVISRRGHEAIISAGLFQACQMRMAEKGIGGRVLREMPPDG